MAGHHGGVCCAPMAQCGPWPPAGHKSAPHMHVLVCICNSVRQIFVHIILMYRSVPPMLHDNLLACFVNTCVFASYSTACAPRASPSILLTVLALALLGQVRVDIKA